MQVDQRRKADRVAIRAVSSGGVALPAGMTLWLDADDASTLTLVDTDRVDTWDDKSASGMEYSKGAVPGNRPQVDVVTINGRRTVSFDGANHWLKASEPATTADHVTATAWTIFVVMKLGTVTTSDADSTKNAGVFTTAGTGFMGICLYDEGASVVTVRGYSVDAGGDDNINYATGLSTGDTCIAIFRKGGGNINLDCVGGSVSAPSAVAAGATIDLTERVRMGQSSDGQKCDIDVGELLIWNRELGSREIEAVKLYLKNKWGIS
jgi:hypothetical protein